MRLYADCKAYQKDNDYVIKLFLKKKSIVITCLQKNKIIEYVTVDDVDEAVKLFYVFQRKFLGRVVNVVSSYTLQEMRDTINDL
jgi:hypothetical protein